MPRLDILFEQRGQRRKRITNLTIVSPLYPLLINQPIRGGGKVRGNIKVLSNGHQRYHITTLSLLTGRMSRRLAI